MDTQLQQTATVFRALSDPTRLRILGLLLTGEVCVCHIHDTLRISQPKASRHLAYLRAAGLVDARRDGLWMHYKLSDLADPILQSLNEMVRHTLTHLETVQKDAGRLHRKTGCSLPAVGSTPMPCCASEA